MTYEYLLENYIKSAKKTSEGLIVLDDATYAEDLISEVSKTLEFIQFLWLGAESVVLLVKDIRLNILRVLKLVRPELNESARNRFVRSARLLASLDFAYFPKTICLSPYPLYLLLDWTIGETFRSWRNRKQFSVIESIDRFHELLIAVSWLHEKSIIHRDIRVDNILRTEKSMKLIDFGLAKNIEKDKSITEDGYTLGNWAYSSEDQLEDAKNATFQDDVFSLGRIFYFLQTGNESWSPENLLFSGLPEQATNFFLRACHEDIEERYKNAGEMLKEYEEIFSLEKYSKKDISEYDDLELLGDFFILAGGDITRIIDQLKIPYKELFQKIRRIQERRAEKCLFFLRKKEKKEN